MKENISWQHIHNLCEQLAENVRHAKFRAVYGIPRGGLIPATIISHYLNIPLVNSYEEDCDPYDVLVVDDIADSGNKLKELPDHMRRGTIFVNEERCKFYPDFFVSKTINWIVFPWEYEEDTVSRVTARV